MLIVSIFIFAQTPFFSSSFILFSFLVWGWIQGRCATTTIARWTISTFRLCQPVAPLLGTVVTHFEIMSAVSLWTAGRATRRFPALCRELHHMILPKVSHLCKTSCTVDISGSSVAHTENNHSLRTFNRHIFYHKPTLLRFPWMNCADAEE